MTVTTCAIAGGDFENGGAASRCLKEQLKKIGATPAVIRRAMVAAYEAEMNVVIHAHRGALRFRLEDGRLDVEVADEGPGIPDVAQALQPGFSTASAQARELGFGAGMGLPNIKASADEFALDSTVGCGTTVRFAIQLKAQALFGAGRHSLTVAVERCRACRRCLPACPTGAIRLFNERPQILDYLCIDCTACMAVCPHEVYGIANLDESLRVRAAATLVVDPPLLAQFGPHATPRRVLGELAEMGFGAVTVTAPWYDSLRRATRAAARDGRIPRPIISPACPAVVNLIEMRFPALIPHLVDCAPPAAALAGELSGRPQTWVITCPCLRTELARSEARPNPGAVSPAAIRSELALRLAGADGLNEPPATGEPKAEREEDAEVLRVTGIAEVLGLLERIEDGQVSDVAAVEPWACRAGCFGSPLWRESPALARQRWRAGRTALPPAIGKTQRPSRPHAPRPGLRLDTDMAKAVQKLGRIDRLVRELPGSDCGQCGAPTCAAFAEDVVLGRAAADACPRQGEPPKEAS